MVIKKLIAISVVFALVAGAAFAVDLGGVVISSVRVAKSVNGGDATFFGDGGVGRMRLEGSGDGEIGIGTIGGWFRLDGANNVTWGNAETVDDTGVAGSAPDKYFGAKAWWSPVEQFTIRLGHNQDGEFDTTHLIRYGFNAQANEIGGLGARNMWGGAAGSDQAIYSGNTRDVAFIIAPMEGVTINIAFPWDATLATGVTDTQIADTFKKIFFQANYNADFGAIHVTYDGANTATKMGDFFVSAYLGSLVEGLGLEVGGKFSIAKAGTKLPFAAGLAAKYDVSDQFGVKLRSTFIIPTASGAKMSMSVDLQPHYAINDSVTAYLDFGIVKGTDMTFRIAPYVRVGAEWGSSFYAGLYFTNDNDGVAGESGVKGAKASWGIPIGLVASF